MYSCDNFVLPPDFNNFTPDVQFWKASVTEKEESYVDVTEGLALRIAKIEFAPCTLAEDAQLATASYRIHVTDIKHGFHSQHEGTRASPVGLPFTVRGGCYATLAVTGPARVIFDGVFYPAGESWQADCVTEDPLTYGEDLGEYAWEAEYGDSSDWDEPTA